MTCVPIAASLAARSTSSISGRRCGRFCRTRARQRKKERKAMADIPRLNGVIRALEAGQHALTCFAPAELNTAISLATSKYDGCVFEMEHNPWDGRLLRDCLQYMLNRAQIAKAGLVPPVTPMVRIPVNGVEMAQWQAKQALDVGCFGIVFPHISTVEEAANAR